MNMIHLFQWKTAPQTEFGLSLNMETLSVSLGWQRKPIYEEKQDLGFSYRKQKEEPKLLNPGHFVGLRFGLLHNHNLDMDLTGAEFSFGGNHSRSVTGLQLGSVNYAETFTVGAQFALIKNSAQTITKNLLQLGLSNFSKNKFRGWQTGLLNTMGEIEDDGHEIIECDTQGVQIGAINYNIGSFSGLQLGLFSNFVSNKMKGLQISGIYNHATQLFGAQVAGLFNHFSKQMKGLQIAGAGNYVADLSQANAAGVQIAIYKNETGELNGGQVAMIQNRVDYGYKGFQIGLFNECPIGFALLGGVYAPPVTLGFYSQNDENVGVKR